MSELPIEERLRNAVQANRNAMPTFSNVYSNDLIEEAAATIAQQEKDLATAFWYHQEWGPTTLPPSTWEAVGSNKTKHTEPSATGSTEIDPYLQTR